MAIPLAIMGGMAALSAYGKYKQAKAGNKPTWQQTNPWDAQAADTWKGYMGDSLDTMRGLDYGPTAQQNWMFGKMGKSAFGGGGGGGGMNMDWQNRNVGRYNSGKIGGKTKGINTAMTDWEKRMTDPKFMDLENDPYAQQRIDAMTQESNEAMARAQAESQGPASVMGTLGASGAAMANKRGIADDFGENLSGAHSGFLNDQMATRYGLGAQANQVFSGREANWDSSMIGADVQGYGSWADAQTAMRGQDAQAAYNQGMLGQMGRDAEWGRQMDMWGMGEQMRQLGLQGQGLGAYAMTSDYGQQMLPYQQGFGKTLNQGPRTSPWGAAAQGAVSGAATGMGFGKSLQGMGYFNGPQKAPDYGFQNMNLGMFGNTG